MRRRIAIGVLVACLMLAAGLLGWMRAVGSVRAQPVDQPARGGLLSDQAGADKPSPGPAMDNGWRTTTEESAPPAERPPAASRSGDSRTQVVHEVARGETLFSIGRRYGVTAAALQEANGLASDLILPGQLLLVPGGTGGRAAVLEGEYIWPVLSPISSPFGPRWGRNHNGLDLASNHGDEVKASRGGEVWVAGEVTGYGQTVIIQHGDDSRTVYAHLSRILVEPGQRVEQGELIALVGSTGNSTGPHLHFEIIVNDQPRDPLLYLPPR